MQVVRELSHCHSPFQVKGLARDSLSLSPVRGGMTWMAPRPPLLLPPPQLASAPLLLFSFLWGIARAALRTAPLGVLSRLLGMECDLAMRRRMGNRLLAPPPFRVVLVPILGPLETLLALGNMKGVQAAALLTLLLMASPPALLVLAAVLTALVLLLDVKMVVWKAFLGTTRGSPVR